MSIYPPLMETNPVYGDTMKACRDEYGYPDGPIITSMWQAGTVTTQELGREVLRLIEEDVADGVMPWDVYDFSELHNYVDANCYTLQVAGYDGSDAGDELVNAVQDWVAHALRGDRPSSLTFSDDWHENRQRNHRNWPPEAWLAYLAAENSFRKEEA